MFGISLPELVIIFGVILILFGPEKLPEIARNMGKIMADLRRHSDALRREFYNSVYEPTKLESNRIKSELKAIKSEVNIPNIANPEADKPSLASQETSGKDLPAKLGLSQAPSGPEQASNCCDSSCPDKVSASSTDNTSGNSK